MSPESFRYLRTLTPFGATAILDDGAEYRPHIRILSSSETQKTASDSSTDLPSRNMT